MSGAAKNSLGRVDSRGCQCLVDVAFGKVPIGNVNEIHQFERSVDGSGTAQLLDTGDWRDLRVTHLEDGIGEARIPGDVYPPKPLVFPAALSNELSHAMLCMMGLAHISLSLRFKPV